MSNTELTVHSQRVLKDLLDTSSQFTNEHTDDDCIEYLAECLIIHQLPNTINDWLDGIPRHPEFVKLCASLDESRPGVGKWLMHNVNVQYALYQKENGELRRRLN